MQCARYHVLRCHPEPFEATWQGQKRHEVRRNDRDFQTGDAVELQEWDPETERYTGRYIAGRITYLSNGPCWGLPERLCCFTFDKWLQGRKEL